MSRAFNEEAKDNPSNSEYKSFQSGDGGSDSTKNLAYNKFHNEAYPQPSEIASGSDSNDFKKSKYVPENKPDQSSDTKNLSNSSDSAPRNNFNNQNGERNQYSRDENSSPQQPSDPSRNTNGGSSGSSDRSSGNLRQEGSLNQQRDASSNQLQNGSPQQDGSAQQDRSSRQDAAYSQQHGMSANSDSSSRDNKEYPQDQRRNQSGESQGEPSRNPSIERRDQIRASYERAQDLSASQYPDLTKNTSIDNAMARDYADSTMSTWRGYSARLEGSGGQYIDGFYATRFNTSGQMISEFQANDGRLFQINGNTTRQIDGQSREPIGDPSTFHNLTPVSGFRMNYSGNNPDFSKIQDQNYFQDILRSHKDLINQLNVNQPQHLSNFGQIEHGKPGDLAQGPGHSFGSHDTGGLRDHQTNTLTGHNNNHSGSGAEHNVGHNNGHIGSGSGHNGAHDGKSLQDRVKDIQTRGGETAQSVKPGISGGGGSISKPFGQPILFPNPMTTRAEDKGTRGVGGGNNGGKVSELKLVTDKKNNLSKTG